MSDLPNLVTTCTFKGREYLVKMTVINGNSLDMVVTDKYTAEDWTCSYDATYIENLTHKTGNFKQFEVFITMLKTGLLKTSECVSLDLLTFDDLELLRSRRILSRTSCTPRPVNSSSLLPNSNRRYFILTYTVEFDRIHYPLPMEYCGPPDPQVLQAVIRRLEAEVARLQDQLRKVSTETNCDSGEQIVVLERRIDQLTCENHTLTEEIKYLNKTMNKRTVGGRQLDFMQRAMKTLEESVFQERASFNKLVNRLREEKVHLLQQVEEMKRTERGLRKRLVQASSRKVNVPKDYGDMQEFARSIPARKPADGISPEKTVKSRRSRTRTPSPEVAPNWNANHQARVNLQGTKDNVMNNCVGNKKTHVSHSQSVGSFHQPDKVVTTRQQRSSSDSSVGSRKRAPNFAMSLSAPINTARMNKNASPNNLASRLGTESTIRGRTRTRREYRSSSATSAREVVTRANGSGGDRSRHSSISSMDSAKSQYSNISQYESGESGMQTRTKTTRARRKKKSGQALKMGMSDLETRIQALQKLLRKGVGPMKE